MWNCPKCDESLYDTFAVCWQCGTDRNGKEDPDFGLELDNGNGVTEVEETERPFRLQFSLRSLFLLVTCTALIVSLSRGIPKVVELVLITIVIANLFGLILGMFVTYVLRIPNDGSLTWNKEESESPSSVDDPPPS